MRYYESKISNRNSSFEKELFNTGRKSFPASDYYKIITQDFEVLNDWRVG